jgi:TM2 domain-containing membrane protein YozV
MIKGVPPFQGESMGEVLMKHLSQEPNLDGIEEPYATVIKTALAKNPEDRYQSAEEMVEALFGVDHVRESVTVFNPQSLTIMAERAKIPLPAHDDAQPANIDQRADKRHRRSPGGDHDHRSDDSIARRESSPKVARNLGRLGGRIGAAFAFLPYSFANRERQQKDPLAFFHRLVLTGLCIFVMSVLVGGIARGGSANNHPADVAVVMGWVVAVWGVLRWLLTVPLLSMNSFLHRIVFVGSFVLVMFICEEFGFRSQVRFAMPVVFAIGLLDLRWLVAPVRPKRLRLSPCLFAGLVSMFAALAMGPETDVALSMGFAIGLTMSIQVLSGFDPKASAEIERSVCWVGACGDTISAWYAWRFPERNMAEKAGQALGNVVRPISNAAQTFGHALAEHAKVQKQRWDESKRNAKEKTGERAKTHKERWEESKRRVLDKIRSKPDNAPANDSIDVLLDDSNDIALEAFHSDDSVHGGLPPERFANSELPSNSSRLADSTIGNEQQLPSRTGSLLLAVIPFVTLGMIPVCGLHRFYAGRRVSGVVWLLTFGLLGVGQLVDIVMIVLGEFSDGTGRNLLTGQTKDAVQLEQVNGLSSVPFTQPKTSRRMVVVSGGMLIVSLALGIIMALDVPRMIDGDIFAEAGFSKADAEFAFGDVQNWQYVMFDMGLLFTCMICISTVLLLIATRAKHGVFHMFRVLPASGAFVGSFFAFHEGVRRMDWKQVSWGMETGRIGLVLDELFGRNDFIGMTIVTGLIMMAALIILAIPPRRARTRVIERVTTLVEQEA